MKEQNSNIIIGIDLGTTNTLVSYIKGGTPRIIPNPRGSRMTPSVVFFKDDKDIMVGELAKNRAVLHASQTVSNVKLSMGKEKKFDIHGKQYTPDAISALVLKHVKEYAQRYLGVDVEKAVITVPAYFDERQREDTLKAAEAAGLKVMKLLNEPTAAALTYGFSKNEGTRFLVVDFGGGTLDITLMEYKDRVYRVRGVGGSTAIGGVNFDELLVKYILKEFNESHDVDLTKDRIAYQQLVIHAEKAKVDLSSVEETQVMIPYITATENGPIHLNVSISRTVFEGLISPILKLIEHHILDTFKHAGLTPAWVDSVILVGGSTRVPALEKMVQEIIEPHGPSKDGKAAIALKHNINPDEAVARGAGIMAGILEGSLKHIEFHDITAHDLGVEDDRGEFITVMPRGTTYPAEVSRMFTNANDDQDVVFIHVLQKVGTDNGSTVSLGWFKLRIDHPAKKGESDIDVTFAIDANGILHVTAVDLNSGEAREISIEIDRIIELKNDNQIAAAADENQIKMKEE